MFGWWMYQAAAVFDPDSWWNPLHTYSVGTCVAQWVVAIVLLVAFNRRLAESATATPVEEAR
jgi:NSS family neurotransmitter:Na+ symporter